MLDLLSHQRRRKINKNSTYSQLFKRSKYFFFVSFFIRKMSEDEASSEYTHSDCSDTDESIIDDDTIESGSENTPMVDVHPTVEQPVLGKRVRKPVIRYVDKNFGEYMLNDVPDEEKPYIFDDDDEYFHQKFDSNKYSSEDDENSIEEEDGYSTDDYEIKDLKNESVSSGSNEIQNLE